MEFSKIEKLWLDGEITENGVYEAIKMNKALEELENEMKRRIHKENFYDKIHKKLNFLK